MQLSNQFYRGVSCDCASVERLMALLISPIRDPLFRDNETWLSQGVKHWLCIGLMNSVDEKEPFSGCKVIMVSKNGRRLLSGVSMVNWLSSGCWQWRALILV